MAMSQQPLPPVNRYTGSFTEDAEGDGMRLNAFGHEDADIGFDPLSANQRFVSTADLAVLGTLVFAGQTRESISVMVPDCIVPPASGTVRVDLRHHIGLSLGPAVDVTNWSPEDNLERAYVRRLSPTPGTPATSLLGRSQPPPEEMKNVNNTNCPDCQTFIKVNMGRHIRLKHSTYVCFWRCPVVSCSLGSPPNLMPRTTSREFTSSRRGHGTPFYECLVDTELNGSAAGNFSTSGRPPASHLDGHGAGAPVGSELRNSYVITNNTEHAPLRRFFKATVDALQLMFDRSLGTSVQPKSLLIQMREVVANCDDVSSDAV